MIAKLTGTIDSIGEGAAVIDVHGVGYLVFCSQRTLCELDAHAAASLLVETQVREDAIILYGFARADERDWFRRLITVQGVGAKAALAILSAVPAETLAGAIAAGDRAVIMRASGVGARLAARVIGELRDAAVAAPRGSAAGPAGVGAHVGEDAAPTRQAVSALVNLGFSASEAVDAVAAAVARRGPQASVEMLITDGLAVLAPKEHHP